MPRPATRSRNRTHVANGTSVGAILERSVAFFGAVDSRPYLFMMNVALQSVQRFHPMAGYFVLLPSKDENIGCSSNAWSKGDCSSISLLRKWSNGQVQALALPREAERLFDMEEGIKSDEGTYSRMTFLRHWMPQALFQRGFRFSVSLDPDTLCVRSWDLRVLLRVELLGGRPVGSSARTRSWLQQKANNASTGTENLTLVLQQGMNLTSQQLSKRTEFNGGVLIFNNSEANRVRWAQTLARYYRRVRHVVEGDQDLLSLVFAAEPSFGRYLLPTIYNYAFRRDRERLPYVISHRLRHGMVGHFKSSGTRGELIMVHFVQDGKPWQPQQLAGYPQWLLATRLFHLRDWLKVARLLKPVLFSDKVRLTEAERRLLGPAAPDAFRQGSRNEAKGFVSLINSESLRRCRCFVRNLAHDRQANQTSKLAQRHASKHGVESQSVETTEESAAQGKTSARELNAAIRQRQALLDVCCTDRCTKAKSCPCSRASEPLADEKRQCDAEFGARAQRFNCQLARQRAGGGWSSANCTAGYERQIAGVTHVAVRSRIFFCRECLNTGVSADSSGPQMIQVNA